MHPRLVMTSRYAALCTVLACGLASCSLDDRRIGARDAGATLMEAARESPGQDEGSSDAGRVQGQRPPRDGSVPATDGSVPATGGGGGSRAGAGATAGGGEGGGAAPEPEAGADAPEASDEDADSGMPEPTPPPPCTAGNTLRPVDSWVARDSNCVGIQGGIRVDWRDESFVQVTLATDDLCAEGFSAELEPSPFDSAFMLMLNEDAFAAPVASDYDAQAHGVVGFEFVVEPPAPQPYFGVMSDGVLYCTRIAGLGIHRVALSDLHAECWNGDAGPTPDPRRLRSIGFYSGATLDDPASYQFCVTDIVALTSLD